MKLNVGDSMPEFKYSTAYDSNIDYLDEIRGKQAALFFLRYYGCTVCQLDLLEIEEHANEFISNDIDLKVVLQSDPGMMRDNLIKKPLSYDIICDPDMELYKRFEIVPAKSKIKLLSCSTIRKVARAQKSGLKHGEYEGEEMQLPAVFAIDKSGKISYSKYAKDLADIPTAEELLKIMM
ncbi:Peroxiredoxin [Dethiosulfatibacter aminovorans DSM 17477]|uniref:Peroxiredoxin n=1 Tax=Dethiosulfatibacter aminovorans DSM 17477 TaxID=1121476 RepID=A0A1M6JP12_9FIRM|nr:redoxin domain-containing protein [Dethiosulfatibacter aminovorans]SHJ48499.1 Peroxiredoxin [Dethiosulfatibacter aminovorans DSM 17477]